MFAFRCIAAFALCATLFASAPAAAQEPTPATEPVAGEPTAEEIEEAEALVQPVQEESKSLETGPAETADAAESGSPDSVPAAWWHAGYLIDYGLVALGGVGYLIGHYANPRRQPLFGASFDFTDPAESINFGDERIDRIFLEQETVPTKHLVYMVPGVFAVIGIEEAITWAVTDVGSPQLYHDTVVGFVESLSLTFGATEILKTAVGRLRPDFTARAQLRFCIENPDDVLCSDLDTQGITQAELEAAFEDGRRSFPSGHASIGTNIYTYLALVLGGRFVWGNQATRLSRGLGIFFQTVSLGAGVFIATSRLDDGRHHDTDVFSGMLLGFGMANLAYWRRFGSDGLPLPRQIKRRGNITWRLTPGPGNGIGVSARF